MPGAERDEKNEKNGMTSKYSYAVPILITSVLLPQHLNNLENLRHCSH
jgi:hypothetical protein